MSASPGSGSPDPGGGQAPAGAQGEVGVALGSSAAPPAPTSPALTQHRASSAAPTSPQGSRVENGNPSVKNDTSDPDSGDDSGGKGAENAKSSAESLQHPLSTSPRQVTSPLGPAVWSSEGTARLMQSLNGTEPASQTQEEPQEQDAGRTADNGNYVLYYACARKTSNLRKDGYQREMTTQEQETLLLWLTRKIHLETIPRFLRATMVSRERDLISDHHMKHLVYRLYVRLPKGFMLPVVDANKHFWQNLTKGALESNNPHAKASVDELFKAQYTTTCEPKDQMVVLTFIRPEVRAKWKNRTMPFAKKSKVILKSSDTLSSDDPFLGYDDGALALQYSCLFMSKTPLTHQQVRMVGKIASGKDPIDVEWKPPVDSPFAPHFWKVTYDQLSCPVLLANVRQINVSQGESCFPITVHHERSAHMYPCGACLGINHATRDCKTVDKLQSIARHSKDLVIPCNDEAPRLSKLKNVAELKDFLTTTRSKWAPALQLRLQTEALEREEKKKIAEAKAKQEKEEADAKAKEKLAAIQEETERISRKTLRGVMQDLVKMMNETKKKQHQDLIQTIFEQARAAKALKQAKAKQGKKKRAAEEVIAPDGADEGESEDGTAQQAGAASRSSGTAPKSTPVSPAQQTKFAPATPVKMKTTKLPTPVTTTTLTPTTLAPHTPSKPATPPAVTPRNVKPKRSAASTPTSMVKSATPVEIAPPVPATTSKPTAIPEVPQRPMKPKLSIDTSAPPRSPIDTTGTTFFGTPHPAAQGATAVSAGGPPTAATNHPDSAGTRVSPKASGAMPGTGATPTAEPTSSTAAAETFAIGRAITPKRTPRRAATPKRGSTPTIPFIPIHHTFATAAAKHPEAEDAAMPPADGMISPRKRARPAKPRKEEDGDEKMEMKVSTMKSSAKSARKREKKTEVAPAEDSDDFEPKANQPTFEKSVAPAARGNSAPKVPTTQSSVTEFFAPASTKMTDCKEGQDELEECKESKAEETPARSSRGRETPSGSSLGEDSRVVTPDMLLAPIDTLPQWTEHFEATIIENAGDGRCLQQAVDGTLRKVLGGTTIGNGKFATKEAYDLTQIGATYLLHYLPQMVKDGTVHVATLHKRYYGYEDKDLTEAEKYDEIVEFILQTMELPQGSPVPENRWSGAEEIFGLTWYLREPILVFSVDRHEAVQVQMYTIEQGQASSDFDEVMKIRTPTNAEAWAYIQTMLNHQVTPRVIVHTCDGRGRHGHFRTFRFPAAYYMYWNEDVEDIPMPHRRENAMMRFGLYAPVTREPLPYAKRSELIHAESQPMASGSVCTPSSQSTLASDASQLDVTIDLSLEESRSLVDSLNPHLRLRGRVADLWKRAEYANLKELERIGDLEDADHDYVPSGDHMTDALAKLWKSPRRAVDLLRTLPHPLVAVAARPPRVISRLGRELTMIGRKVRIAHWKAELPEAEARLLDTLVEETEGDTDKKWRAVQRKKLWDKMGKILKRDVQQHRTLPSSDEEQMLQMMVALVVTLPIDQPCAELCDSAHAWISTNGADARQLLTEMRCNQWTRVYEICDEIQGQPSMPRDAAPKAAR